jgi:hypothetical protein
MPSRVESVVREGFQSLLDEKPSLGPSRAMRASIESWLLAEQFKSFDKVSMVHAMLCRVWAAPEDFPVVVDKDGSAGLPRGQTWRRARVDRYRAYFRVEGDEVVVYKVCRKEEVHSRRGAQTGPAAARPRPARR